MNTEQSDAIRQLYFETYDMLIGYAQCALQEESLAEEAVQETFRIACQKPEKLLECPAPKGWLVNTLKYTIRNMQRSRENARQLLPRYLAAQTENITFSENKVSLEVAYENVADLEEFKLLKEMAVDGRSYLEMANARGITVSACKKRVQRAKEILRKKL